MKIWQEAGRAVTARGPVIPASDEYVSYLHFGETPGLWWLEFEHDDGPRVHGPYDSREEAEEWASSLSGI